jgi:hypothetical protein
VWISSITIIRGQNSSAISQRNWESFDCDYVTKIEKSNVHRLFKIMTSRSCKETG